MTPPMPAPSTSTVTRAIYLGTLAALLVVGTLSVLIYRSTVNAAVEQHSTQQLTMVRTAAAAIQGELRGLAALLRQFNSIPSVQNLDVPFLAQRIAAAFGQNPNRIVRYIGVTSAPGLGTSIELLLPRAPDMAPATTTPTPTPPLADGLKETVLVVEDEDAVRMLVVELLTRGGYLVIQAASGEEAQRVADAFEGTIHVLLSDVVMPRDERPGTGGPVARGAAVHPRPADVGRRGRCRHQRRPQGGDVAVEAVGAGRADQGRAKNPRPAPFAETASEGIIAGYSLEEI